MNNEFLTETKDEITNENQFTVPYIVHEGEMARMERQLKRLWIVLIVAIALLAITNIAWLWYINQYDFESYGVELSTEGGGNANFIGSDGDIYNGTSESPQENPN